MKKINELTVEITFNVCLQDAVVTDSVFNGLIKMTKNPYNTEFFMNTTKDEEYLEAWEWLSNNINVCDANTIKYDIDEFY